MTTVWQTIYLPLGSLVPALIYFYVCTSIDDQKVITKIEKLLVLPFLFFFGVSTLYKLMNATDLINEENGLIFLALSNLHEVISFFFLIVVLIVSLRIIYRFKKSIKPYDHTYIQPRLNWLQGILLGLFFIALWYGYYIYMTYTNSNGFVNYYVVWILNSFLIYFLGHIGIYKFGIQEQRKKIRSFASDKKSYSISEKHKNEHAIALEQLVVGEKVYLNAEVTLEIVAEKLCISKSLLSRILNSELGKSFSDYINSLRVEEAKTYLQNPDFSNYTIVAIGLEAGFSSKTTFNTAFKKYTGETPSQYRKNNRK